MKKAKTLGKQENAFADLSLNSTPQLGLTDQAINSSNTLAMRILLLDDDTATSSVIIELLEGNALVGKLELASAENLKDYLEKELHDLLIITKSEYSIEELIRINQNTANLPAILISNETDQNTSGIHGIANVVSTNQPTFLTQALQRISREIILKRQLQETQHELAKLKTELEAKRGNQTAADPDVKDFSQLIFAALTDSIAALNSEGIIVHTNQIWKDFSRNNGGTLQGTAEGANYLEVCKKAAAGGDKIASQALQGITEVISNIRPHFELEYSCNSETERRWFLMRVTPFTVNGAAVLISHVDISDKKSKEIDLEFSYKELLSAEKINHALIGNESTEELADFMLQSLYEMAGVQRSRIYLYNKNADKLELYAQRIPGEISKKIEHRTGVSISTLVPELIEGSLFHEVVKNKRIIFTNDDKEIKQLVSEHTSNWLLKKLAAWAQKMVGIKTFGLFPLIKGEEVIGVLSVTTPLLLNERERKTVLRFVQHASLVISRKLDQEKLQSSEEKFKAISNYTANWETWFDTTGKPIWINAAVYNHSGYTAEELLAMPDFYEKIIYHEDYPLVMNALKNSLTNRTEGDNLEFRCNHKNGSTSWFSVSWKQVYSSTEKWIGVRTSGKDITLRKNQESELIRKQNELNEVQQIARLGSWEWHVDSEEVILSEQLCSALGFHKNKNVQTKQELLKMVGAESQEVIRKTFQNLKGTFKPGESELIVHNISGQKKHFLVRASFSTQSTNLKTIIRGSALDITELRTSYEQAQKNEERFRKIFDSIQDVYYQTNREGIVTLVSPSVFNLLGYTPEEITGQPVSMLYVKPKMQELRMARRHMLGEKEQFEASLLSKNGDEVVVSINLSYLEGTEENQEAFQGLMRNITEKKRQEKSLENQRKRLLEIVKLNTQIIQTSDHFYYVIQIMDQETRLQQLKYVSTPVTSILGLTELDVLNRDNRWLSLIHPEDTEALERAIDLVFTEKKPQRVSYRIEHNRSKEIIWLDDYICPLLNGNNDVVEIYGSIKDVSERVNLILKIESEKRQSVAYQYQLLSSQLNPHFIYNTLNTFQYYILQGNIEGSLNHISDFSKLMRKVLENSMYNYITLDEEIEFLEHYMRISKQRMKEPLEFTIEVDDEVETGDVMIPPMLLQPYLENAMIHGFNECPRKPELKLTIQKNDHVVQCIVEDNGIGREKSILTKGNRAEVKRSYAMGINKNRIDLLNQITEQNFEVIVEDLKDENDLAIGTRVFIRYHEVLTDLHT